jgi:tetratricopeptide (TPR) repeat protein
VNRVSSTPAALPLVVIVVATLCAHAQVTPADRRGQTVAAVPQKLFTAGEAALHAGKLDEAEHDFRQVLTIDPGLAGAYANLGVIHMRRKQWPQALAMLHKAEKLAPSVAGIRLNIGLVYFRQNDFHSAIQPFETVVRDAPGSYQARYLLGLCYFFNERWREAVGALEPLWGQASDQLNYLYVLGRAAEKANNPMLAEKAYGQLGEIGQDKPAFRLIMGKAHLNREEYDDAVRELEMAAKADPKLPFVHFNLGLAFLHKQQFEQARAEFQKDLAIEPDVAFTYEQLAGVESTLGNEDEAAKNYRQALKLNARLVDSHLGVAKIEQHRHHYGAALTELDQIVRLEPSNASARYLRGQVLMRMGREREGRQELAAATKMLNQQRTTRQKELEGTTLPSPELAREPE